MRGFILFAAAIVAIGASTASATPAGPNGKIAFGCAATPDPNGGATSAICVMNPDGTGRVRILDGNGEQPAWSPDGTKIAFVSSRNSIAISLDVPSADIWVMNADGSNPVQLTFTGAEARPAWSADGRIAFTSYRDHIDDRSFRSSIYVMNPDGSNQHAVTTVDTETYDDQPAWSPDGKTIAFVRFGFAGVGVDGGYQEIYTVNDDGTNFRQLTVVPDFIATFGLAKNRPSWSPDGMRVAFTETPWLDQSLAAYVVGVVTADGSNEHFLTTNADELPNGPNVDILDAIWSPDGAELIATCSFLPPTTTPGDHLCIIDAATGAISAPIDPIGPEFDPDWGQAVSPTVVPITDCNDPQLAQLNIPGSIEIAGSSCTVFNLGANSVGGNLDLSGDTATTVFNLGLLNSVGGNLDLNGDISATVFNLGSLNTVGRNLDLNGDTDASTINLGSLNSVGGNLTLGNDTGATTINLGSLNTVGADLTLTGDTAATAIDLGSLTTVGGNLTVDDNSQSTVVNLGSGVAVGGNLTLESAADAVNLGATETNGSTTLVANGSTSVSGNTGGTTTDVSVLGGTAAMRVVIPSGAFVQPVPFTITRLTDLGAQDGTGASGAPATIQPLGGYVFSFGVPTLNADAQLAFRIDLSQLDADTRAAVLGGAPDSSATIAVKGDASGSTYQAFSACAAGQTPETDGCVVVTVLDAAGELVTDPAQAAFVNLAGVAGHFSTYAAVLVTPRDLTPPSVTMTLTAPNAGVPDGRSGWFVSGPVSGTVNAVKTTGRSTIASLTCGSVPLTLAGLGTQATTGTFAIATDGITHVACTASDTAGNTSAPLTVDVQLDRTPPALSPTVTPAQVALNGAATATPNASDTVSGLATASCGTVDTSTAGPHTVTCTATDSAGNTATATAAYTVAAPSDLCLGEPAHQVLAPIAPDGSSVFVRGLPVPVRFRVCDAAGHSIKTGVVGSFRLVGTITDGATQILNLPVRSALPGVGFFWNPLFREWDFLLATNVLRAGTTYVYEIALTDGSRIGFQLKVIDPKWTSWAGSRLTLQPQACTDTCELPVRKGTGRDPYPGTDRFVGREARRRPAASV